MTTASPIFAESQAEPRVSQGDVEDYVALLKPRVMFLVVFTALVGMVVKPSHVHPVIAFASLVMIAVGAGASGCLNMWWDADVDAIMTSAAKATTGCTPSGSTTMPTSAVKTTRNITRGFNSAM